MLTRENFDKGLWEVEWQNEHKQKLNTIEVVQLLSKCMIPLATIRPVVYASADLPVPYPWCSGFVTWEHGVFKPMESADKYPDSLLAAKWFNQLTQASAMQGGQGHGNHANTLKASYMVCYPAGEPEGARQIAEELFIALENTIGGVVKLPSCKFTVLKLTDPAKGWEEVMTNG